MIKQQKLCPIILITKPNYKLPESSCALARPNQRSIWFGLEFSLLLSLLQGKESKAKYMGPTNRGYVLSFACAKESTKEKHTANDEPLPMNRDKLLAGALIKLQYYADAKIIVMKFLVGIPTGFAASGLLTELINSYHRHRPIIHTTLIYKKFSSAFFFVLNS